MSRKQALEIPPSVRSLEEWAVSEILRAGDHLNGRLNKALKPLGVSFTQYTALRILRDEKEGLASSAIGDRMFTSDSDVTRLVDRLVRRGWAERSRDEVDRRVVRVRLTPKGHELVERLDGPTLTVLVTGFAGIKAKRIRRLIETLRQIRDSKSNSLS